MKIKAGVQPPRFSAPSLMFAGVAGTFAVILGYKFVISPFFKKRSLARNEEFANFVFEQEQKAKGS